MNSLVYLLVVLFVASATVFVMWRANEIGRLVEGKIGLAALVVAAVAVTLLMSWLGSRLGK
jgi:hypothetical protein